MNERVTKPERTARGEESQLVIQGQTRACGFVKEAGYGPACGRWETLLGTDSPVWWLDWWFGGEHL